MPSIPRNDRYSTTKSHGAMLSVRPLEDATLGPTTLDAGAVRFFETAP